jgi:hypothetical protein
MHRYIVFDARAGSTRVPAGLSPVLGQVEDRSDGRSLGGSLKIVEITLSRSRLFVVNNIHKVLCLVMSDAQDELHHSK